MSIMLIDFKKKSIKMIHNNNKINLPTFSIWKSNLKKFRNKFKSLKEWIGKFKIQRACVQK